MINYTSLKTFKKNEINGLTKLLCSVRFANEERKEKIRAIKNALGLEHMGNEYETVNNHSFHLQVLHFKTPRKITKEQSDFGKAWLKNHCFRLSGGLRLHAKDYSDRMLEISKNVSRFEFIGVLEVINQYSSEPIQVLPIYRTFDKKGEYFDYAPIHWGRPIIIEGY